MGGACSTHWRYEKFIQNVGRKILKKRDQLRDVGVDECMILKCIFETQRKNVK